MPIRHETAHVRPSYFWLSMILYTFNMKSKNKRYDRQTTSMDFMGNCYRLGITVLLAHRDILAAIPNLIK